MAVFSHKRISSLRSGAWKDFVDPHVGVYISLGIGRLIIALGIIYRFLTHPAELVQAPYGIQTRLLLMMIWSGYLLFLTTWLLPVLRRSPNGSAAAPTNVNGTGAFFPTRWVWSQIVGDSVFFTLFYCLTMKPDSDFFLFYFVPVLVGCLFLDFSPIRILMITAVPLSLCLGVGNK
jgi:hypothetical protein